MTEEVVVTRKGQTTIPIELRKKYKILEGSKLEVLDTGEGVLLRPKISFLDLIGSGAEKATVKEMNALLDKLRRYSDCVFLDLRRLRTITITSSAVKSDISN
jgi:AbrB family looped-hinge helix DNA binding protein